jgi:transposase InsO family protein
MKYAFIGEHSAAYLVRVLCKVLEVSESGYYAWRKRVNGTEASIKVRAEQVLVGQIKEVFAKSHQTYGSPRVLAALKTGGVTCSRKRVARLMRRSGLVSCWRRKKRHKINTTDSHHQQPVAPNRLDRDFTANAPNQKWVGDITGVWTAEGWLYLAALVDMYSRSVVGWSMDDVRDEPLVENALWMALSRRQPSPGLLHHTDRGSHFLTKHQVALLQLSRKPKHIFQPSTITRVWGVLK